MTFEEGVAWSGTGATVPPCWQIFLPLEDRHQPIYGYSSPEKAEYARKVLVEWALTLPRASPAEECDSPG
jgi:alkanesulfonate monooxygenase SsuD/methylene tetrahydromethanopterin reductase-like flavin-dependent oxidoreductase (luciferase family)